MPNVPIKRVQCGTKMKTRRRWIYVKRVIKKTVPRKTNHQTGVPNVPRKQVQSGTKMKTRRRGIYVSRGMAKNAERRNV